ncbi:MAG: hypothetical protein RLW87_21200 [Alphaproteobacteria bacterium]
MRNFFPIAADLKEFLIRAGDAEMEAYFQSIYTEGPPASKQEDPVEWGKLREKIAEEFSVNSKYVFLIGSAKSGYSLSPSEFGRSFSAESDIDLAIVSDWYLNTLAGEFLQWKNDFDAGSVQPRGERERISWLSNKNIVPKNISKGFIDLYKIPALGMYATRQDCISKIIKVERYFKNIGMDNRGVSVRFFLDFDSFRKQHVINLKYVGKKLAK